MPYSVDTYQIIKQPCRYWGSCTGCANPQPIVLRSMMYQTPTCAQTYPHMLTWVHVTSEARTSCRCVFTHGCAHACRHPCFHLVLSATCLPNAPPPPQCPVYMPINGDAQWAVYNRSINSSGTYLSQLHHIRANGFWGLRKGCVYFLRIIISLQWEAAKRLQ